jgi:hypothetical protein
MSVDIFASWEINTLYFSSDVIRIDKSRQMKRARLAENAGKTFKIQF